MDDIPTLIAYLRDHNMKITCAESCTGGLIASLITDVSGASRVFDGSVVTYSESVKRGALGVAEETLKKYGVVSEQCALEMAMGAARLFSADVAVSATGWAGPYDGDDGKPKGSVCIGVKTPDVALSKLFFFDGDRNEVRMAAAKCALSWAYELLCSEK